MNIHTPKKKMTQLKWQNLPLNTLSSHIPVQTLHAWGHRLVLPWFDFRPFLISLYLRAECVSFLGRDGRAGRPQQASHKSAMTTDPHEYELFSQALLTTSSYLSSSLPYTYLPKTLLLLFEVR